MANSTEMLASTAHWTAAVRALESTRPDRLFNDPWAEALAGETGRVWMDQRTPESVIPIILRTRYFDDFLERTTRQVSLQQVVLVGAGLDTRAYRLKWPPGTRLFELDQPGLLAYKEQVLLATGAQPACQRQAVGADLTEPWQEKLLQRDFDPLRPTLWLLEGFLFYLSNTDLESVLDQVTHLAAAGSWAGFDVVNNLVYSSPFTLKWVEMQAKAGAPWISWLDDPHSFLAERGWRASLSQAGAPEANFGRWNLPVIPTELPGMPHNWYVTAEKL